MSYNYHKMEFRGLDEPKESVREQKAVEDSKADNARVYYGCRNDVEESELKGVHNLGKDGPVTVSKPADVKNGDLVSLLLAATPPYLYNIPLIPQTFFFSEMLKSFVQAKTERQSLKAQQSHHKRQRKRSWREMTPPKPSYYETSDKPLELTTPKQSDDKAKDKIPKRDEKKCQSAEFVSSNFTAEKLANSSIGNSSNGGHPDGSADVLPPTPPLWYPPLYPPHHPPFGIDPLHFFIDLRVSAHVWDRKSAGDGASADPALNFKDFRDKYEPAALGRNRHRSAFSVPQPRIERDDGPVRKRSAHSVHYLMSNLKNIYKPKQEDERGDGDTAKKCKDLSALIGLELVVDYVKQESDGSEDEEQETVNVDMVPEVSD